MKRPVTLGVEGWAAFLRARLTGLMATCFHAGPAGLVAVALGAKHDVPDAGGHRFSDHRDDNGPPEWLDLLRRVSSVHFE
ncbi:hypothetical protein [Amycolatopsis sp. lyj-108]|uniref:hypothetical protein n=1 Tax=Amycolatopsis sp. lyj-108 TaxID=2789286 RepID=UPI0039788B99